MKQKILLIGGPTAVGKTSFGIKCAKLFDGEIISADCEQIYKTLDIGSAKASKEEQSQAKHHLLDIKNPTEEFSVAEFKNLASKIIDNLTNKNKLPIVVGGTGLYMQALLFPYSFCSSTKDDKIRQKYSKILDEKGKDYLFAMLEKVDPKSAKVLHKNDTKRVIRALEIYEQTGKKKSEQQESIESEYDYKLIFLNDDRKSLYDRINYRVEKMMNDGLEQEVKNVISSGVSFDNQSMQGIGYREFRDYFDGKINKKQLIEKIQQDSRNYAKRQITWFKHRPNCLEVNISNSAEIENALNNIKDWIKEK